MGMSPTYSPCLAHKRPLPAMIGTTFPHVHTKSLSCARCNIFPLSSVVAKLPANKLD